MSDMTDTPASPALTLNVKRIRTHVRGGVDLPDGKSIGLSAKSLKIWSLPPMPNHTKPIGG
ncbi:MAG: hypothetical protein KIT84_02980 [Labilithrix sp.]|nr:hypothetical protein [Labilithrix sp.]MCW5809946.1 hypothetical protein [Labilithrix sp.]